MDIANLAFLVLLFVNGGFGAEADAVEVRELVEGDTIVLETKCVTKLQKDDVVEWTFNSELIATMKASNPLLYDTEDAKFKDKLQMNAQTGDLTVRNAKTIHSGHYEVKITNNLSPTHRRFTVTVLDLIPRKVSVTAGQSAVLQHNIADINRYDLIVWRFEDRKTPIAQINKQNSDDPTYDKTEERFRDRLKLDQSGSLTITDTRAADSGLYKLQVEGTNVEIKHRRFRVQVDEAGLSTGLIVLICAAVITLILVVMVGIYCRRRCQKGEDKGSEVQDPLKGEQ